MRGSGFRLLMSCFVLEPSLESLPERVGAYLFDCDGTLVDTMGAHYQSWMAVLADAGATVPVSFTRFCTLGGMSGVEVALRLRDWAGVPHADPEPLVSRKREAYLQVAASCPPIAPVAEFARRVAATHPVAVVSGGHRQAVELALTGSGLRSLFPVVVTPEDVRHGKPAPDMFLLAAERLGVAPATCLVFEDGLPGIEGARAAGMKVVVVKPAPVPV